MKYFNSQLIFVFHKFYLKILFLTVKKVLVRDGISGEGEVTMSKFTGTKD